MDNPTTLLVAIMYVTIVATGLVNVLMTLSEIVGGKAHYGSDPYRVARAVIVRLSQLFLGNHGDTGY